MPLGLGLREQVQRGHQHQHPARPQLLRAAHGHQGLARAGRHDHLRPQPPLGHSRPRRQFERAQHRVDSLTLMGTESLRHVLRSSKGSAVVGDAIV